MLKRIILGATLSLTVAGGALAVSAPVSIATARMAAPSPAPVEAARVASGVQAARLSPVEMREVTGAGFWNRLWRTVKKVVKSVASVVIAIVEWIVENLQTVYCFTDEGCPDGGETLESTETTSENYASQNDYDSGLVSGTSVQSTSWVQTSVWYGGGGGTGGCGGGGGDQPVDRYAYDQLEQEPCAY